MSDERRFPDNDDERRLQRLSDTIYNLLGFRDPDDVAKWIGLARSEILESRRKTGMFNPGRGV